MARASSIRPIVLRLSPALPASSLFERKARSRAARTLSPSIFTSVAKILTVEGEPGPTGGRWNTNAVRSFVLDDVYKPHTQEEVAKLVSPEVAALLDRDRRYGIWWFNRERWRRTKVSEPPSTGEGRVYRSKVVSVPRPREEWVAVPVPDSGIPRETDEAARHIVANNKPCSSNGDRFWELSGGVLRCSECGRRMRTSVSYAQEGRKTLRLLLLRKPTEGEPLLVPQPQDPPRRTRRARRMEPRIGAAYRPGEVARRLG